MKCDTTGIDSNPELQWITWYKDNVLLDNITFTGVITEWSFTPHSVGDNRSYTCSAGNVIGPSVFFEPIVLKVEGILSFTNFSSFKHQIFSQLYLVFVLNQYSRLTYFNNYNLPLKFYIIQFMCFS